MGLIGVLLSMPWLHIRIGGGVLLLYVTFGMLQQHESAQLTSPKGKDRHNTFLTSIIAIIAADVGMSLDNVISHYGSRVFRRRGFEHAGLSIGISRSFGLRSHPSVFQQNASEAHGTVHGIDMTYLCAAYLTCTSVKMIFEDK